MTQKELNEFYELPDINLAYKFSYLAKTVAMCLFFMPIFPLGFILGFAGFILAYFLEKFNFTHLSKRPDTLNENITYVYADYFIIILFIGGIGDYIFLHNIFENNKWALVNIIVFGVLIIIPYTKLLICDFSKINKSEEKKKKKPLSEVYFTFYTDYQRQNPLTKRIGLLNYLKELKKKDYLSKYAYDIAEKNIEQLNIMEIYYEMSTGRIPLIGKSMMVNADSKSIIQNGINGSILKQGRGVFKSTMIMPKLTDNEEKKKLKKKLYDSQVINMFKSAKKMKVKGKDTIDEDDDDEETEKKTNEQLNNSSFHKRIEDELGLGPSQMTQSKCLDKENNKNNE